MPTTSWKELDDFLKDDLEAFNVVVMPDFFLDRIISLEWNLKTLSRNLEKVAKQKGGSIDNITQKDLRGGNAINTASALAALGMKVTPIVCTDKLGLELIKFYLRPYNIDLSHVKIFDKASITTAVEIETRKGKANIMLRNVNSLASFGPQHLDSKDFETIEKADYICVFNWAGTKHYGTKLAKTVFHHAKTKGKGKTYYDTADPTPNKQKIPELMRNVLQQKHVDILSVNENEATCYAAQLSQKQEQTEKSLPLEKQAEKSAKTLAAQLSARIDLHTTGFSATYTKKSATVIRSIKVPALRTTGAGDAWNAGNIVGDAHALSDRCRLALANIVAAYYISSPDGSHPTSKQLTRFCEKLKSDTLDIT